MSGQLTKTMPRALQRPMAEVQPSQVATALGWFSIGLGAVELLAAGGLARTFGMRGRENLIRGFGLREIGTGIGLLTARDPAPWLWGRVGGDALDIATLAAQVTPGNRRRGSAVAALGMVAGVAALDAWCAFRLSGGVGATTTGQPIKVTRVITVARPAAELFQLLREPDTLPRLLAPFATLQPMPDGRMRWTVDGLRSRSWTSATPREQPDSLVSWQSEPGGEAAIPELSMSLQPAPGALGTAVTLAASIVPPGGPLGRKAVQMFGGMVPGAMADATLHYLKALAETGEIPTTRGQPAARADTR